MAAAAAVWALTIRSDSSEIKKNIGYMTQRFSFYEDLTIEENLDFIARIYGVPARKAAVEKSLERLGMTARRGQLAGHAFRRLETAAGAVRLPDPRAAIAVAR